MRWCFLASHEIPEGDPVVIPPGESSHICIPCSKTPRGQMLMQKDRLAGYRPNYQPSIGKWSRIYQQLGHRKYKV